MKPSVLSESEPQAMDELSIRYELNGVRTCFQWYIISIQSSGVKNYTFLT